MGATKDVNVETDLAVRRLVARYCQLIDDHDLDAAGALFTDDAKFHCRGVVHEGTDAIKAFLDGVPDNMRHQCSNVVVSNGSKPSTYHSICDLTVFGRVDGEWSVTQLGRYHDTLVGEGRDIHFSQRILTHL